MHGNISRNGYGNAIIGWYGGCFVEDIRRCMCDRAYRITGSLGDKDQFWGPFIADYAVWALLIVEGRTVTYSC